MTPRANTSASNLHRRVRCEGSHFAEIGLPEVNSEYAEEGTRLHAALESLAGTAKGIPAPETGLSPAQEDLVVKTLAIFDEVIERTIAVMAIPPDAPFEEGYERELRVRQGLHTIMPGHCDYWRVYPEQKVLIIQDAKFGFLEVTPAPLNLQLRAYALMGVQEWRKTETVIVAIAQPRAGMIEGAESLTIARYDGPDLVLAYEQLIDWEKAWLNPEAPRRASEDACRYCKAKLICPQYAERSKALLDFPKGIADLSEELFGQLWEALCVASNANVQDQIKAEARVRVAEGRLPGYRLKPNAPRRSIEDGVQAARLLSDALDFTQDEVAEASKISLGKTESILRRKTKLKAKEAKAQVSDALTPVIVLSTPLPSIVPVSEYDKAAAV